MKTVHTEASGVDVDEDKDGVANETVKVVNLVIVSEIMVTLHEDSEYMPSRILTQRVPLGHYSSCQMRRRKEFVTLQPFQPCSVLCISAKISMRGFQSHLAGSNIKFVL